MYIGFCFFFCFLFFFLVRIRGFALPVYHMLGCFFCLDWVCFTFKIDVGLFCELALLQIYIYIYIYFFFSNFSSKIFWAFFFFFFFA